MEGKDIIRQQIQKWKIDNVKKLIEDINEIELNIKKYSINSINFISNFILEKLDRVNN